MRLYMYQFHLYGEYSVFSEPIDDEDLFCDCCLDSDELVYEFDTESFGDDIDKLYVYQDCEGDFYVVDEAIDDEDLYNESRNDYDILLLEFEMSEVCAW